MPLRLALNVRLHKTLGQLLNAGIRMRARPRRQMQVIFQTTMLDRKVLQLQYKLYLQPIRRISADGEAHGIRSAFLWKSRAAICVSKVAGLQFHRAKLNQFASRGATCSTPSRAKRQTTWMR